MAWKPSKDDVRIVAHLAALWGPPSVLLWSARGTKVTQQIASQKNTPARGLMAYSTVGFSTCTGYEIATIGAARNRSMPKVLFDIASYVLGGPRRAVPGAVFEKAIARFYTRVEAGHLYLTTVPFHGLAIPDLRARPRVRWLYAWPVTADELATLEKEGPKRFDVRLRRAKSVDLGDLYRRSLPGAKSIEPDWSAGMTMWRGKLVPIRDRR